MQIQTHSQRDDYEDSRPKAFIFLWWLSDSNSCDKVHKIITCAGRDLRLSPNHLPKRLLNEELLPLLLMVSALRGKTSSRALHPVCHLQGQVLKSRHNALVSRPRKQL